MNSPIHISVLAPILSGAALMVLSIFAKAVLDAEKFRRHRPERGQELFRVCFLGPDFIALALALLTSSRALNAILSGHKIQTFWGENFGDYFWALVAFYVASLFLCAILWIMHDADERSLRMRKGNEERQDRAGGAYLIEIWAIEWRESLTSRAGIAILLFGNLLGIVSILAYASFIFFGFVRKW